MLWGVRLSSNIIQWLAIAFKNMYGVNISIMGNKFSF